MSRLVSVSPNADLLTTNWTIEAGNGASVPPNHWTAMSDQKPPGHDLSVSQWTRITIPAVLNSGYRAELASYTLDSGERCKRVRTAAHAQMNSCRMGVFLGNGASGTETLSRLEFRGPDGEVQLRAGPWASKAMDAGGVPNLEWTQTNIDALRFKIITLSSLGLGRPYFYSGWIELEIVDQPSTFFVTPTENQVLPETDPTVVWAHSVPEIQKKFELKVFGRTAVETSGFNPETSTQAVYKATGNTSSTTHKVSDGILMHGESYYVFVKTAVDFNGEDWWSEWNAGTIFKINAKPEVTVIAPVSPVIDTAKPMIQWTYDDEEGDSQSGFRVIVLMKPFGGWPGTIDPEAESLAGDAEYDSGLIASVETEHQLPIALTNGETFRAYIQVQQRLPAVLLSEWGYLEFDTEYQAPLIPTVTATPGAEAIEIGITPSYPNLMSADGSSFETATGGWTTEANNTIAQSATQFLDGTKSLAITRTTSTGTAVSKSAATTGGVPVIVGQTYTASAYFRANTTSRTIRVDLEFIDASNAVISTVTGLADKSDNNTSWTRQHVSGVAPANAVRARMSANALNAVNTEVHYIDQAGINLSGLGTWNIGGGTLGLTLDPDSSAQIFTDNVLKPNQSSLETDTSGWFPWDANTTIARSTAQAQQGTASLLMTRITSTGDARATTHRPPSTSNMLTAQQSGFETGISPWLADTNTTVAQSSTQELEGSNSLAMTKTVGAGTAGAFSDVLTAGVAVLVGEVYTAAAYFRANTTARAVEMAIQWINSSNAIISTSAGVAVNDNNTGWVRAQAKAVAPATAVRARVRVTAASAALNEIHFIDKVSLYTGSEVMPCKGNQEYTGMAQFRAVATPRTCTINFEFFDVDGAVLTHTDLSFATRFVTDSTSAWTACQGRVVSPPGARFMAINVQVLGCAISEQHYTDAVGVFEGEVNTWVVGRGRVLDIIENFAVIVADTLIDWTPDHEVCLAHRWDFINDDQSSWAFWLQSDGKLRLDVTPDGTEELKVSFLSTAALSIPAGTKKCVRFAFDSDFSPGSMTAFYSGDTLATATTQLGSNVTHTEPLIPYNGYAELTLNGLGMDQGGWQGYAYEIEMRDNFTAGAGNILTYQDFSSLPLGTTIDFDPQGNKWLILGDGEIEYKEKPNPDVFNVERSRDGGVTWENFRYDDGLVFSDRVPGSLNVIRMQDHEVPVNVSVMYRTQAISTGLGFDSNSEYSAEAQTTLIGKLVWIKDTIDPTKNRHFKVVDDWLDITHTRNRQTYQPMGRDRPIVIRGSGMADTMTVTFILESFQEHEVLHELIDSDHLLFLQTPKGSWWVEVSNHMSLRAHLWDKLTDQGDLFIMSVPFQEVDRLRGENESGSSGGGGHG